MASRPGALYEEDYLENLKKTLKFMKNDLVNINASSPVTVAIKLHNYAFGLYYMDTFDLGTEETSKYIEEKFEKALEMNNKMIQDLDTMRQILKDDNFVSILALSVVFYTDNLISPLNIENLAQKKAEIKETKAFEIQHLLLEQKPVIFYSLLLFSELLLSHTDQNLRYLGLYYLEITSILQGISRSLNPASKNQEVKITKNNILQVKAKFLFAGVFIDSGNVADGLELLKEIQHSQLDNEEDYLIRESLQFQKALTNDTDLIKDLEDKVNQVEAEMSVFENSQRIANIYCPEYFN